MEKHLEKEDIGYDEVYSESPHASTSDDRFSIESILMRVDDLLHMEDVDVCHRLKEENTKLQQCIATYEKHWIATMELLQEAYDCLLFFQNTLHEFDDAKEAADGDWLAYWGV